MNAGNDELVFVPLGGLGEIGMNLALTASVRSQAVNGSWSIAA